MKTKEIEIFLPKYVIDVDPCDITRSRHAEFLIKDPRQKYAANFRINGHDTVKAKLIIELPERKVTITETQFDEALKMSDAVVGRNEFKENLKARLFNQGGEG